MESTFIQRGINCGVCNSSSLAVKKNSKKLHQHYNLCLNRKCLECPISDDEPPKKSLANIILTAIFENLKYVLLAILGFFTIFILIGLIVLVLVLGVENTRDLIKGIFS